VVPAAVRETISYPATVITGTAPPAAGGGTVCWMMATLATARATQAVLANAPHFVLPRQNRAATRSGQSAE
jgi:hypothetical protein